MLFSNVTKHVCNKFLCFFIIALKNINPKIFLTLPTNHPKTMFEPLFYSSQILFIFLLCCTVLFLIYSIHEKEPIAVKRTVPFVLIFLLLLILNSIHILPVEGQIIIQTLFVLSAIIIVIPFGNKKIKYSVPEDQFDERDIMFSRMELKEGTQKFEEYYDRKKGNRPKDDEFRKEPGLLSSDSKFYHPYLYKAAEATFTTVDQLHPIVEGNAGVQNTPEINVEDLSVFLRNWAKKLGAVDVGFTEVKKHHVYSYIGRGAKYGDKVELPHQYALAFTVEMDHESLNYTPQGPIIMESAQQYLNAGTIAVQLAQFLRNMGYEARAHIDANYRLICPIVAQDAGLGTIGRMGLLMTPKLGPRVRVGVVTTNLELKSKPKAIDSTLIEFCEICKKCSVNCPSGAVSDEKGVVEEKRLPWKINHEKCFTYWCKAGTDCGRCVAVCPYSHPDNFMHNVVRWALKRNPVNRRLALKLDDYFYGQKPPIRRLKGWSLFSRN